MTDCFNDYEEDMENNEDEHRVGEFKEGCSICHHETIGETCGFCGAKLCPACFEMGGGFCDGPHTQEQIDAYEEEVTGCPIPQARKDLRQLGLL